VKCYTHAITRTKAIREGGKKKEKRFLKTAGSPPTESEHEIGRVPVAGGRWGHTKQSGKDPSGTNAVRDGGHRRGEGERTYSAVTSKV